MMSVRKLINRLILLHSSAIRFIVFVCYSFVNGCSLFLSQVTKEILD